MAALDDFKTLCLQIYRTAAIQYSAMNTYMKISAQARDDAVLERDKFTPGNPQYALWSEISNSWTSILSSLEQFRGFMVNDEMVDAGGVFPIGEEILDVLGLVPTQSFSSIVAMDVIRPLSFTEVPTFDVPAMEALYSADFGKLNQTTNPWSLQLLRVLKEMTFDIYKGVGSARWFDEQVKPLKPELALLADVDVDYAVTLWDMVQSEARSYMHAGRSCLSRTSARLHTILGDYPTTRRERLLEKAEFMQGADDTLICAGGLYLINALDLHPDWRVKIEDFPTMTDIPSVE